MIRTDTDYDSNLISAAEVMSEPAFSHNPAIVI